MTRKYSVLLGLEKSIFKMIMIGGPLLAAILPEEWMNVTLGIAIAFVINYAKNKDEKNQDTKEVEDSVSQS